MNNSIKDQSDKQVIDSTFRNIIKAEDLQTHLIYAGDYYRNRNSSRLRSWILEEMKTYKIKQILFTRITLWRGFLITKEKMEDYCKGKMVEKASVNDDLESFFEDLRLDYKPIDWVLTYFLPKLTKEELKLVERKDPNYMNTFSRRFSSADVDEAEMKLSESKSKFVNATGLRTTMLIETP